MMALWGGRWRACRVMVTGKQVVDKKAFSSGRDNAVDPELEAIFRDAPPPRRATVSSAAKSSSGSDLWKNLTADPARKLTESEEKQWDFLKHISPTHSRSMPRPDSLSTSFRKIGDRAAGLDFLDEAIEQPEAPVKLTGEELSEEEGILKSASFKLIRDTFQKDTFQKETGTKARVEKELGFEASLLLSSQFSKALDNRGLQDFEDSNFYSVQDQAPVKDAKTYSYQELGEKLRQVRPPSKQLLSSATGLSFGELLARFQKIEQMEDENGKGSQSDYKVLKEGFEQLRKPSTLSSEDMVFLNNFGGSSADSHHRIEYTPPNDELLTKYYSDTQLSSKERLKLEIKKLRAEFQTHEFDSGSPQVQIAILTARINNLNRHMREGPNLKRDKHTRKGLNDMVHHRKRLLQYLRRCDWPVYCNVLTKLKLDDVILERRR